MSDTMSEEERIAYCEKREKQIEREELDRRLNGARIPPRFRGQGFEEYRATNPGQQHALDVLSGYATDFEQHRAAGRCLTLLGGIGTGKTHLACAVLQQLANYRFPQREGYAVIVGYRVRYTTAPEIIRTLRATWNRDSNQTEEQAIQELVTYSLLVIDEVGVGFGTDGERAQLSELIDARYRVTKPTLVISNFGREGLAQFLGERVVDRLRDNGGFVCVFDWGSYRQ
jgi:DNA replication protein DnaC